MTEHPPRLLLTVEESMQVKPGRLMLGPHVPAHETRRDPIWVELRRSDVVAGTVERVQALVLPAMVKGSPPVEMAAVVLVNVAPDAVPPGTEVWTMS